MIGYVCLEYISEALMPALNVPQRCTCCVRNLVS